MDTAEELIRRECGVWDELQTVPSYCERFVEDDEVVAVILIRGPVTHDDEHPFCWDAECPCHGNPDTFHELVDTPFREGLLTEPEATRLFLDRQV